MYIYVFRWDSIGAEIYVLGLVLCIYDCTTAIGYRFIYVYDIGIFREYIFEDI